MHNPIYKIETPRCILRPFNPSDSSALKDTVESSLDHLKPWMPWARIEPVDKKIEQIRNWRGSFDLDNDYVYGIFGPDNRHIIGSSGLHTRRGDNILEIGYWIRAGEINKGYATEISDALCYVAFYVIGVERIEIHCAENNVRSAKIPEKLGFHLECIRRSNEKDADNRRKKDQIWVMFKEEYLPRYGYKLYDILDNPFIAAQEAPQ